MFPTFVFFFCTWRLNGVCGDPDQVKQVSVMEGHSVTLQINTELHCADVIMWTFGPQKSLIAHSAANSVPVFVDVHDRMFKDRLQVDAQTGSLTITNITTQHSGLYHMTISRKETSHRFNVIVYCVCKSSCDATEAVIRLVVSALVGVAAVAALVVLIYDIKSRRAKRGEDHKSSNHASPRHDRRTRPLVPEHAFRLF